MPKTPRRSRALIYVRGTAEEIEQQIPHVSAVCERRGHRVVGIMREQPGATEQWHEANRMLDRGEVDAIVIASANLVPDFLESATGALPGRRTYGTAGAHRQGRRRRIRPMRRGDAGA